jgi:hypothetical protein
MWANELNVLSWKLGVRVVAVMYAAVDQRTFLASHLTLYFQSILIQHFWLLEREG